MGKSVESPLSFLPPLICARFPALRTCILQEVKQETEIEEDCHSTTAAVAHANASGWSLNGLTNRSCADIAPSSSPNCTLQVEAGWIWEVKQECIDTENSSHSMDHDAPPSPGQWHLGGVRSWSLQGVGSWSSQGEDLHVSSKDFSPGRPNLRQSGTAPLEVGRTAAKPSHSLHSPYVGETNLNQPALTKDEAFRSPSKDVGTGKGVILHERRCNEVRATDKPMAVVQPLNTIVSEWLKTESSTLRLRKCLDRSYNGKPSISVDEKLVGPTASSVEAGCSIGTLPPKRTITFNAVVKSYPGSSNEACREANTARLAANYLKEKKYTKAFKRIGTGKGSASWHDRRRLAANKISWKARSWITHKARTSAFSELQLHMALLRRRSKAKEVFLCHGYRSMNVILALPSSFSEQGKLHVGREYLPSPKSTDQVFHSRREYIPGLTGVRKLLLFGGCQMSAVAGSWREDSVCEEGEENNTAGKSCPSDGCQMTFSSREDISQEDDGQNMDGCTSTHDNEWHAPPPLLRLDLNLPRCNVVEVPLKEGFSTEGIEHLNKGEEQEIGRCRRSDGKGWQCSRPSMGGVTVCEYHFQARKNRQQQVKGTAAQGYEPIIEGQVKLTDCSQKQREYQGVHEIKFEFPSGEPPAMQVAKNSLEEEVFLSLGREPINQFPKMDTKGLLQVKQEGSMGTSLQGKGWLDLKGGKYKEGYHMKHGKTWQCLTESEFGYPFCEYRHLHARNKLECTMGNSREANSWLIGSQDRRKERCHKNDGKGWQCCRESKPGSAYCEYHIEARRNLRKKRYTGREDNGVSLHVQHKVSPFYLDTEATMLTLSNASHVDVPSHAL